jgi:hypothetical protein
VWGVGKEISFICGGENFFIGTAFCPLLYIDIYRQLKIIFGSFGLAGLNVAWHTLFWRIIPE